MVNFVCTRYATRPTHDLVITDDAAPALLLITFPIMKRTPASGTIARYTSISNGFPQRETGERLSLVGPR